MDPIGPANAGKDPGVLPAHVDANSAAADVAMVAAVVAGDETAFLSLIDRWTPMWTALATRIATEAPAEAALMTATWRRALDMLRAFRDPPGLRVLLVRALLDEARASGLLVASAAAFHRIDVGPAVDATRFLHPDDPEWPGHWARAPEPWPDFTDTDRTRLESTTDAALEKLPEPQRLVVAMRDCGGCHVEQISRIIGVSPGQVRNLLHRARATVRAALEDRLTPAG
jgi:RNA polymerase sigma-70 factor (ECF subfamily)